MPFISSFSGAWAVHSVYLWTCLKRKEQRRKGGKEGGGRERGLICLHVMFHSEGSDAGMWSHLLIIFLSLLNFMTSILAFKEHVFWQVVVCRVVFERNRLETLTDLDSNSRPDLSCVVLKQNAYLFEFQSFANCPWFLWELNELIYVKWQAW